VGLRAGFSPDSSRVVKVLNSLAFWDAGHALSPGPFRFDSSFRSAAPVDRPPFSHPTGRLGGWFSGEDFRCAACHIASLLPLSRLGFSLFFSCPGLTTPYEIKNQELPSPRRGSFSRFVPMKARHFPSPQFFFDCTTYGRSPRDPMVPPSSPVLCSPVAPPNCK